MKSESDRSCLQLNDTSIFLDQSKNYPTTSSEVPRGVTRWGDGGPLQAVAAPLTPRQRGTNYEAMPFICLQPNRRRSAGRGLERRPQP